MMPLSRSVRNICEEPFFRGGVASLFLLMSSNVRMRRLSRAERQNIFIIILCIGKWLSDWMECFLFISFHLRLASCSTTESKKSCGVMYSCPSYSTEANFMNRRSRDVNLIAFSESSCRIKKNRMSCSTHGLFEFTVFIFILCFWWEKKDTRLMCLSIVHKRFRKIYNLFYFMEQRSCDKDQAGVFLLPAVYVLVCL